MSRSAAGLLIALLLGALVLLGLTNGPLSAPALSQSHPSRVATGYSVPVLTFDCATPEALGGCG